MSVGRRITSCFNSHLLCTPNWEYCFRNEHFWPAKLLWETNLGSNFHQRYKCFGRERVNNVVYLSIHSACQALCTSSSALLSCRGVPRMQELNVPSAENPVLLNVSSFNLFPASGDTRRWHQMIFFAGRFPLAHMIGQHAMFCLSLEQSSQNERFWLA